jgi:acetylglutamate synthase
MALRVIDREEAGSIDAILEEIDIDSITGLIGASSGKKLDEGYFSAHFNPRYVFIEVDETGAYGGIGIVEEISRGVFYLDKFFVAPEHQGNGLGKAMFGKIMDMAEGKLGLRACSLNEGGQAFYGKMECLKQINAGGWKVYVGEGLSGEECMELVEYAVGKPSTLN